MDYFLHSPVSRQIVDSLDCCPDCLLQTRIEFTWFSRSSNRLAKLFSLLWWQETLLKIFVITILYSLRTPANFARSRNRNCFGLKRPKVRMANQLIDSENEPIVWVYYLSVDHFFGSFARRRIDCNATATRIAEMSQTIQNPWVLICHVCCYCCCNCEM